MPNWTESDIVNLKGQEEGLRLEFKAGALLDKPESEWVSDLSKEISAFANTEGGTIVLGLREVKDGKHRVAGDPDGVRADIGRDHLQRKVEGNVFPYLPGIRVQRIPLASTPDRVVFVFEIPQGATAYQANDGRYYGRSELEAKHLPDHEIRLRMARGKIAQVILEPAVLSLQFGDSRRGHLKSKYDAAVLDEFRTGFAEAAARHPDVVLDLLDSATAPDVIRWQLVVRNSGELTVCNPIIEFHEVFFTDSVGNIHPQDKIVRHDMSGEVIYPGDCLQVAGTERVVSLKRAGSVPHGTYVAEWKVFLNDAPPSRGQMDLGEFLNRERGKALLSLETEDEDKVT